MSRSANHFFTGAGASGPANYIEDVFSTFLYTGDSAVGGTERVSGVPMSGVTLNPGMIWVKNRSSAADNYIYSSPPGSSVYRSTNTNAGELSSATGIYSFPQIEASTNGFYTFGDDIKTNQSGQNYVSWTFKEQSKFFDVVAFTYDGSTPQTIAHNLGSTPGCILFRRRSSATQSWYIYHRGLPTPTDNYLLFDTGAYSTFTGIFGTGPTSTNFQVKGLTTGEPYVAYLFAHDAGGFGLTGSDNIISCGSTTGSAVVNLGYEPQWVMSKCAGSAGQDWTIVDNMRGAPVPSTGNTPYSNNLMPNLSNAENTTGTNGASVIFNSTGFRLNPDTTVAVSYIYIAIRRGPMKVPTVGTTVFSPLAATNALGTKNTTNFPVDLQFAKYTAGVSGTYAADRLRGVSTTTTTGGVHLITSSTAAETSTNATRFWDNTGFQTSSGWADTAMVYHNFRRAPGFFDEVCWTGDGTNPRSLSHNLTVAPTLIITKKRNSTSNWITGYDFASTTYKYFNLNDTGAAVSDTYTNSPVYGGNPTASVFIVGNQGNINQSSDTYVSYLFATCAGVSKVGSYTGTATTLQVDCGFTAGARFVLIKRTDSTGDWYVWDTARGIIAGNDPYSLLNSTAAQVTNTDYIDTYSPGFELSSTAPAAINASGGTFIFLAIA
jgi:hypothetical protein